MARSIRDPIVEVDTVADLGAYPVGAADVGEIVYLKAYRDYFQLRLDITAEANGETLIRGRNADLSAAGEPVGRPMWQRLLLPHISWMAQSQWTIDPVNGKNDNLGNAAAPLKDDTERLRRMGPCPQWGYGGVTAYDINVLGDIDLLLIQGEPAPDATSGATIRVHGNASTGTVTGAGKSPALFTGGGVSDTVVAQDPATDQAYTVLANDLGTAANPANWAAIRFKRVRWTSGTALGATMFATKDLTSKVGQMTNTIAKDFGSTNPIPATGDTFVVEDLVQVRRFQVSARSVGVGLSVLVESLKLGQRDANVGSVHWTGNAGQTYSGCEIWNPATVVHNIASPSFFGCWFNTTGSTVTIATSGQPTFVAGGCRTTLIYVGNVNMSTSGSVGFRAGFQIMDGSLWVTGKARLTDIAVFDATDSMIRILQNGFLYLGAGSGWNVWGGGAGITSTFRLQGSTTVVDSGGTINVHEGSAGMINIRGATACDRYDPVSRTWDTLAAANLTKANYLAALGSGGFNRCVHDPLSGTSFQLDA